MALEDQYYPTCHFTLMEAPETIIHILRDCSKVKPIWTRVGNIAPDFYFDISMKPWIKIWSLSSRHTDVLPGVQWRDVFPILSWSIWSTRDKSVMEGAKFNTQAIFHRAKSLAIEFHFSLPSPLRKPDRIDILVGWKPPPSGFFKLNTDGLVLGNLGLAGARGLLRHSNGSWFRGFTRNIGTTSSVAAKLWGVRDGLLLAKKYNIQKLIIELDAKAVLDLLMSDNNTSLCYHPLSALIIDCRSLIHSFEEARLCHIYREGNFCTDNLAKGGTKTLNSYVEYFSPPSFVVNQLLADTWGVSFPRACNI
uniref:RNase H type-1 domain-containing protein n=1 Tax=Fagus sylvatica TaxID=28930 RepID=A0A2N9FCR0_FAGSY